ncbi:MAG TPA: hypothetical protein VGM18_21105 [Candidatus Sulfotelmatobacter sp.]|jgi:hypothetical protein
MEQPCYKCGQAVEQGIPFCPYCAAPQIRVVLAEPAPESRAFAVGVEASDFDDLPASKTVPVLAVPAQWSEAVKPCALAALVAAAVMVLQLVSPIIAVPGAGFLAVAFYLRRGPGIVVAAGAGARLGALCGLFSFGIATILEALRVLALHKVPEIRQFLLDIVQQTAVRNPDPQLQPGLEFMRSPAGLISMMLFLLIFALVFFLLLGTVGGALGGAVLGRRGRN